MLAMKMTVPPRQCIQFSIFQEPTELFLKATVRNKALKAQEVFSQLFYSLENNKHMLASFFYYQKDWSKVILLSSLFGFLWVCLFCSIFLIGYWQPRFYIHLMLHSEHYLFCVKEPSSLQGR